MKLDAEKAWVGHRRQAERLGQLTPSTQYDVVWCLRHEGEIGDREAVVSPELPELPPQEHGYFLMRLYVKEGEVSLGGTVDLPQVTSRPHAIVWSETTRSREFREYCRQHKIVIPAVWEA